MKRLITVVAAALCVSALLAKEVVWTGSGSGGWGDPENWSEAPVADDIAVIPADTLVRVASSDLADFRSFGGYRLESGSTLFLDAVTFPSSSAFSKPLTGSGSLVAVGGSMYLSADNGRFDGTFAFTNNYCEVHHPCALGTTNEVWLRAEQFKNYYIKVDRADGPNVMSNSFFFAGPNARCTVFQAVKSGFQLHGPVKIVSGWCQFLNDTSHLYWTSFRGGIYGDGYLLSGSQKSNVTEIACSVDLGGGLVTYNDGFQIRGRLERGSMELESAGKGFVFHGEGLCCTNDLLVADPIQVSTQENRGGFLDLNGFSQTIGNINERIDRNGATTESNFFITSAVPATLTVVGSPNRRYAQNGFAGLLQGALSLSYDWDGRPGLQAYYTPCTAGLFKLSSGGSMTGEISCRRGDFRIESTASLPNVTALSVSNTGKMTVSANGVGAGGAGMAVHVSDSGTLTIGTDVTITAKKACVGGIWLEPGTYGGEGSAAPTKLVGLSGSGVMTVAEYGGPKGFIINFQ